MAALPTTGAVPGASSQALASDANSLDGLRRAAGKDPKGAAREAAKAFESLFMNQLLKTMRASTEATGMFENQGSKLGTEMLDAQLVNKMVGQPGGLSDVIARQLERQMGMVPGPIPRTGTANTSLPVVSEPGVTPKVPEKGAAGFVQQHRQAAEKAAGETGIPAQFMLAQAALETGWGKREIIGTDGSNSHNLFGIKAGSNWNGPTVDVTFWSRRVRLMVSELRPVFLWDRLYIGGGNSHSIQQRDLNLMGDDVVIVPNSAGVAGGVRAWQL